MREFKNMNASYSRMFGDHRPARTTVQVAGLPGEGLLVEIDAIAYRRTLRTPLVTRTEGREVHESPMGFVCFVVLVAS